MVTYKFFVDPRVRRGGVRLRVVFMRRKFEVSLGVEASAEELEDALRERPLGVGRRLSSTLRVYDAQLRRCVLDLHDEGVCDMGVIKGRVLEVLGLMRVESAPGFESFFREFARRKDNATTRGMYEHTLKRIGDYCDDKGYRGVTLRDLRFEDVGVGWLNGFEAFLARTACKNARNIHLRNVRAVFNGAIDEELTVAYPFRRFKVRPEATRKRSLSVDELRELFECEVEEYAEFYRDMFKLIFMLIGINTVDLWGLKCVTGDGRVEYRRAKTHRLYSIKVEPEAMEIIERYGGEKGLLCIADRWSDHRNFRHQLNKALQYIGVERNRGGRVKGGAAKSNAVVGKSKGKWGEVSSYWARHSWATIAAGLDIPKETIAAALGHGGNSVTDIYIDFDMRKVDEANRRVLDWVLYGKR